jgi:hypothetical protein
MKKTIFMLFLIVVTACAPAAPTPIPTPTVAPTPAPDMLFVDPAFERGTISPYVLGSNYGPWIAVPAAMIEDAYNSNVTAIRFPGGEWGDKNDLKSYHIDAFIQFCEKVGAMPTISVRLMGGTPEQAAELVRYVNVEKKYGVKYWSIGNEPTLYAKWINVDHYDTARLNQEWRAIAVAMEKVDPSILLIGPEVNQYDADPNKQLKDANGLNWMDEFLKANGDMVDVVAFHRYPFGTNPSPDDLRNNAKEWDDMIVYLRGQIHRLTGRDIPIAITEVNTNWNKAIGGDATPETIMNAVWYADLLGQMIDQGVFMINHWLLTSAGGQGTWGLIGSGELRPSYYTVQLYAQFGETLIYSSSGIDNLNLYAAKRKDGSLTLMIVNLNDDARSAPLTIKGVGSANAQLFLLDADHRADDMGAVILQADAPLTVPGRSVSLYVIKP